MKGKNTGLEMNPLNNSSKTTETRPHSRSHLTAEQVHKSGAIDGMDHVAHLLRKEKAPNSNLFAKMLSFSERSSLEDVGPEETFTSMHEFFDKESDPDIRKKMNLCAAPIRESTKRMGGTRSGRKIVDYRLHNLRLYRALIITSRTLYSNWDTWEHIIQLISIQFITQIIATYSGSCTSIPVGASEEYITNRIEVLLGFILTGFVGYFINRYMHIRHHLVSDAQNLFTHVMSYLTLVFEGPERKFIRDELLRLARLSFALLFKGLQGVYDLHMLYSLRLLKEGSDEDRWIKSTPISLRPFLVLGWFTKVINMAYDPKYSVLHNSSGQFDFEMMRQRNIMPDIQRIRWAMADTQSYVTTPLPFMYSHLVYWIIQVFLYLIFINTGLYLAVMWTRRHSNGDEEEDPYDDPSVEYPENDYVWYFNLAAVRVMSNVVYALFVEGLLKVCQDLENPLESPFSGFPEYVYSAEFHNQVSVNMAAMDFGGELFEGLFDKQFENSIGLKESMSPANPGPGPKLSKKTK